jgi:hypothetical protein
MHCHRNPSEQPRERRLLAAQHDDAPRQRVPQPLRLEAIDLTMNSDEASKTLGDIGDLNRPTGEFHPMLAADY